jgi:hypothetical protein
LSTAVATRRIVVVWRRSLLGLALAGCSFGANPVTGDAMPDSNVDAPPDAFVPLTDCFGKATFIQVCIASQSTASPLTLNTSFDTDTSPLCRPYLAHGSGVPTQNMCVVAGSMVTVPPSTTVVVTGSKPLVVVSPTMILISGTLSVASTRGGGTGAAGDPTACMAGLTMPSMGVAGGGGWGGSFNGLSVAGGDGGDGAMSGNTGGKASAGISTAAVLRGGCPGIDGAGVAGGARGHGGGAIEFVTGATGTVQIDGIVNASGSGGGGGSTLSGGGGAGAGGMIAFDADIWTVGASGQVFANGGGGGEGGDSTLTGAPGSDATAAQTAAPGGSGNTSPGGDGGAGFKMSGRGANGAGGAGSTGGGGGGGGGGGLIKNFCQQANNVGGNNNVSPQPS